MIAFVTRRTLRRHFLLRPDSVFNDIYMFALAFYANKYGIQVHAVCVMSTHEHLLVTDTQGLLPRFLQDFHRVVALCLKIHRKWEGAVWDHEKASVVDLCTQQAVLEKAAYLMANPVEAGLVRNAKEWPGIKTLPHELGKRSWTVKRPKLFFGENSSAWPETVTLELTMPPLDIDDDEAREVIAAGLKDAEKTARANVKTRGWNVLGRDRVLKASPYKRAKSWEPIRGRNPHFAVGADQPEARVLAVQTLRAFREAYQAALDVWRTGIRTVVFPSETWLMRVLHKAEVATG
jgi:putative transposase